MSKTFITSDLHLNHTNIIDYCDRPFTSVQKMNKILIDNWNNIINKEDKVYFLGDLCFSAKRKNMKYWLNKLNGEIIFIKGNHDKSTNIEFNQTIILNHKGHELLLIHNYFEAPYNWKGWIISGHSHNKAPYIDRRKRKINVSVDVTNFKPVNIDEIIKIVEQGVQ